MDIHDLFTIQSTKIFGFVLANDHRIFSLNFVKCQMSEILDKYLRKIFLADDPCQDWLIQLHFDSKGPTLWLPFCLFQSKMCDLVSPIARLWHKGIYGQFV